MPAAVEISTRRSSPYETAFIDVSGGHRLAYELCGNPQGRPVLFLHGGPSAGCSAVHRRFFLRQGELLDAVPRFRHVPGLIVHGRYDMLCPADAAFVLAAVWPDATLHIVPDAGHAATEPGIRQRLVNATDD